MKSGKFDSPDEEYDQIEFVYSKLKGKLPEEYNTFEKFCGCLVYGGLTAYSKILKEKGLLVEE